MKSAISEMWGRRQALAAEVDQACKACEAADRQGNPGRMTAAEDRWCDLWDELHDLDDKIIATTAVNAHDVAIKGRVFLTRSTDDLPYVDYARRLASDLISTER
jgi:hypothetical protein